MLLHDKLKPYRLILASQSPRRHELLTLAGIPHKIFVSGADEGSVDYVPGHPEEFVTAAAELKNAAVRKALADLPDAYDPKKYLAEGRKAVQARVQELIRLLGSSGKA